MEPVHVGPEELKNLLPSTTQSIDGMFQDVVELLGTIEHPGVKALADAYLADAALMSNFRTAPAATALHHAWIGGLLEHTSTLLKLADQMLPLYPQLSRDVVLLGLFIHDLDKTTELTWEKGFEYTAEGNLIGHLAAGATRLELMAARVRLAHSAPRSSSPSTPCWRCSTFCCPITTFQSTARPSGPQPRKPSLWPCWTTSTPKPRCL